MLSFFSFSVLNLFYMQFPSLLKASGIHTLLPLSQWPALSGFL